jgi:hypothetical protein
MSCRRPRLLPHRRAAPPLYTDTCTMACGHRGEDDRFLPHVDAPAFEPRWNAPSLVMPPSCQAGKTRLQVSLPSSMRAALLAWPSLVVVERRALPLASTAPRRADRTRVRACARRPDAPRHRAPPARTRVEPGGQVGPWSLSSRIGLAAVSRSTSTAAASPWPRASCSVAGREGKRAPYPWPP